MRKELYNAIKTRLEALCVNAAGEYYTRPDEADVDDELYPRAIKHIDLWNRNVEFIDQDTPWERPAVFIEFEPIRWNDIVPAVEYRAEANVRLHIVTDWAPAYKDFAGVGIDLDLPDKIHDVIAGIDGETFKDLQLAESHTNHDHEDIVESIEVYSYVAIKSAAPKAP